MQRKTVFVKPITLARENSCRGFVREHSGQARQLRKSPSSAEEGRPLGARIDVMGINHSISASAVFGDFYRCAPHPDTDLQ